jgi:hypothetical protein
MEIDRIEAIDRAIDLLEGSVPQEGGYIYTNVYGGGPDETEFYADQTGYMRLGLAFMKAGSSAHLGSETQRMEDCMEVFDDLATRDNQVHFDQFLLRVDHNQEQHTFGVAARVLSVLIPLGCLSLGISILVLAFVGLVTLISP